MKFGVSNLITMGVKWGSESFPGILQSCCYLGFEKYTAEKNQKKWLFNLTHPQIKLKFLT